MAIISIKRLIFSLINSFMICSWLTNILRIWIQYGVPASSPDLQLLPFLFAKFIQIYPFENHFFIERSRKRIIHGGSYSLYRYWWIIK